MRATAETHGMDKMPPIRIVISDSEDNEDVRHCNFDPSPKLSAR